MRLWWRSKGVTIPIVRLVGAIGIGTGLRPGLSLHAVEGALQRAFRMKGPAVAIIVNSPGGSPAQSSLIYHRVRALAEERDKRVLVFVEDVAASGGYWLALAGDEIFADPTSIVGSIGVVSASFGFTELIEKLGVERRVYTIGENKAILDPFQPEKASDVAILKTVQGDIHDAFVAVVEARRSGKLGSSPDLFTGRVWSGRDAASLGLVDGLGEIRNILRERYGRTVRLRPVGASRSLLPRLRFAGTGIAGPLSPEAWIGAVRADRLWDRYGL